MSKNYKGNEHRSPIKGSNHVSKMTRNECEHALARTDEAVSGCLVKIHQVAQRRRALVKRIMKEG